MVSASRVYKVQGSTGEGLKGSVVGSKISIIEIIFCCVYLWDSSSILVRFFFKMANYREIHFFLTIIFRVFEIFWGYLRFLLVFPRSSNRGSFFYWYFGGLLKSFWDHFDRFWFFLNGDDVQFLSGIILRFLFKWVEW